MMTQYTSHELVFRGISARPKMAGAGARHAILLPSARFRRYIVMTATDARALRWNIFVSD